MASADNPLFARVMVNRIWQYHFGSGSAGTPSDFGTRAGKPSHPELLDWLAAEFVERKWSMKAMHKLIMTSDAYRRSANASRVGARRRIRPTRCSRTSTAAACRPKRFATRFCRRAAA